MRLLNTGIDHLHEDVHVVLELDHELLLLLDCLEGVFVHDVRVVEKDVVLAGKLHLDVRKLVTFTLLQGMGLGYPKILTCTRILIRMASSVPTS